MQRTCLSVCLTVCLSVVCLHVGVCLSVTYMCTVDVCLSSCLFCRLFVCQCVSVCLSHSRPVLVHLSSDKHASNTTRNVSVARLRILLCHVTITTLIASGCLLLF